MIQTLQIDLAESQLKAKLYRQMAKDIAMTSEDFGINLRNFSFRSSEDFQEGTPTSPTS